MRILILMAVPLMLAGCSPEPGTTRAGSATAEYGAVLSGVLGGVARAKGDSAAEASFERARRSFQTAMEAGRHEEAARRSSSYRPTPTRSFGSVSAATPKRSDSQVCGRRYERFSKDYGRARDADGMCQIFRRLEYAYTRHEAPLTSAGCVDAREWNRQIAELRRGIRASCQ